MVELELCRALRAFIEEAVKSLQLPVEPHVPIEPLPVDPPGEEREDDEDIDAGMMTDGMTDEVPQFAEYAQCRTPKVFNGYLPPKHQDDDAHESDDFPFIVVRPDEATSTRESTMVTVSIIFGAYSASSDGYEHCLNMASRVRQALMSMPFLTLDGRYQLRDEITWRNTAEQPWPFWQVDMTTHWLIISPQPVSGVEDL